MEQAAGSYSTDIILRAVTVIPPATMQGIDTWRGALAEGQYLEATDVRDDTVYTVTKMSDGKIWMIDNLAIDLVDTNVQANLTPETTNASGTAINALLHGDRASGDQYAASGINTTWNSGSIYSNPKMSVSRKDTIPNNSPTNGHGKNKTGGHYNYCAAAAGAYCYESGAGQNHLANNITEDICPAGWRLPTGGADGEYQVLGTATIGPLPSGSDYYTDPTLIATFRNVFSMPFSGWVSSSGSLISSGEYGYMWSSTLIGDGVYRMYSSINDLRLGNSISRDYGFSVRCVAQVPAITVTFDANGGTGDMLPQKIRGEGALRQNAFTNGKYTFIEWNTEPDGSGTPYKNGAVYAGPSVTLYAQWEEIDFMLQNISLWKDSLNVNDPIIATDARDSQEYPVVKLSNGTIWMAKNLNIAGGTTLTPTTSNVTREYTLPDSSISGFSDSSKAYVYNDDSLGGSYSYAAATAGTNPSSGDATQDICLAGWRLPTRTEYNSLVSIYNSPTKITSDPWNGTYGGGLVRSGYRDNGSQTYYWAATATNNTNASSMYFYEGTTTISTYTSASKNWGMLVRCIAK